MFDIAVVIVSYNVKNLLGNCIKSVLTASKNLNVKIIVVDNNSFDGSPEYVARTFPSDNITIIRNEKNLGFAKANNIGAKSLNAEYLLILNPDTILKEDSLEKSLEQCRLDKQIGALSCKLILPNGNLDLACRRSFPNPSVAISRILGLSKLFPKSRLFGKYNLTYLDEDSSYEVDAIVGAFMLIRKDVFDLIGGFDEDYFMYGEDLDLCYRIKKAGYKIFYYSGTSIVHYKGESTKKSSISYVNHFYGAMKIFTEKNLGKKSLLLNTLIKFFIWGRALVSYTKRFLYNYYPVLLDLSLIVFSMLISIWLRFEIFPLEAYTVVLIVYSVVWISSLSVSGCYRKNNTFSFIKPVNGILAGFFINSAFTYFFNQFAFSRVVVLRSTAYAIIALLFWRFLFKLIRYSKQRYPAYSENNTLIIGKDDEAERFLNKLRVRPDQEYNIIGFINPEPKTDSSYIGNLNNIGDVIKVYRIKTVVFVKRVLSNQRILDTMWALRNSNLRYMILSEDSELILGKSAVDKIENVYLMQIEYNINRKINIFVKRIFDISVSGVFLILIYPFIFLYSGFSKNKNNGIFVQKILQLPVVLSGRISLIGRAEWDTSAAGKQYLGKKGLTGLVQINFYKNLEADDIEYYNFYYAKNQSLSLDIEILLKTFSLIFFRRRFVKL